MPLHLKIILFVIGYFILSVLFGIFFGFVLNKLKKIPKRRNDNED
jgi:hypothetical protein